MKLNSGIIRLIVAIVLALIVTNDRTVLARDCTTGGGCRDFVQGHLRADLSEVYYAMDYKVKISAAGASNAPSPWFTTGWLGVFLAQPIAGQADSGKFSQVGIQADSSGISWFLYAEPGVECLEGNPVYYLIGQNLELRGCRGNVNQYVSAGGWSSVELVTYLQGYWIARVVEPNGTAHDVAKILSGSARIYSEVRIEFEESYGTASDPHYIGQFYFSHPQYMFPGSGFREWSTSSVNDSYIASRDLDGNNTFCSQYYGALPYYGGDKRAWYTGTGGGYCDWLLFPSVVSYLPDVKAANGWTSQAVIRNNSSVTRRANVVGFNSGSFNCSYPNANFAGNGTWTVTPCSQATTAVVEASQDVSVVVRQASTDIGVDNGFLPSGLGDPVFERSAATLYAPAMYNNIFNVNSTLEGMNTGSTTATVTFNFKGRSGYIDKTWPTSGNISIVSNGRYELPLSTVFGASAWVGSLVATSSNQPIAIKVSDTRTTDQSTRTYNASAGGSLTLYGPGAYKTYGGSTVTSSFVVQNVGGSSTTAELRFYNRDGTVKTTCVLNGGVAITSQRAVGVSLSSSCGITDASWVGSVRIVSTGASPQPLVATVGEDGASKQSLYNAASNAASTVYLPRMVKSVNGFTSSFVFQNINTTSSLNVTATYYDSSGNQSLTPITFTLNAYGASGRWLGQDTSLPDGWTGSIVLTANTANLVAIAREESPNVATAMYNGIAR